MECKQRYTYNSEFKRVEENIKVTKINVLKEIASVYNPHGLLCPVILQGKVLLQNLWKKQLEWDS